MKSPYVKIEYTDCSTDYGYTICPWSEVESQISQAQSDFEDIDEIGHEKYKPKIKLSVVFLTDTEWEMEFEKWDR